MLHYINKELLSSNKINKWYFYKLKYIEINKKDNDFNYS